MLFPEDDAPQLKAWIVKRIENTSDADSDVLADYVIALLKHDGDPDSVRKLCEQEIPDFLTEEPKAFLDDVFEAITWKSYKPGAPPPPTRSKQPASSLTPSSNKATDLAPGNSKKRSFNDQDDEEVLDDQDPAHNGQRAHKQPRRGGRRGRMDDTRLDGFSPMGPPAPLGMPTFDPNDPMAAIMQLQAMGFTYPSFPSFPSFPLSGFNSGGRKQPRRKGRCRDFDTKGYCSRGSTCLYDHGNDSLSMPPMLAQNGDEYDPNDASLTNQNPGRRGSNSFSFMPDNHRGRGGRKGRGGKKGGARASFSADGPVNDRSKTTIVVENIPEESFNEEEVRSFFVQFGNVVEVSMQPYKRLAIVKYDNWGSANAAYRSPKVIFDNRFVKVFWYKDDGETIPNSVTTNGYISSGFAGSSTGHETVEEEPPMDPEEFQKRQEEAQKQFQEREARRTDIERQRLELEKQQQDLLIKHREETERLQAKLAGKNGGDPEAGSSGTDMLRAKLAALEQEAKILGIDPDAAAATDDGSVSSGFRGGYRGRGSFRGRGFAPRLRGSFRGGSAAGGGGRGGPTGSESRHAAYAQYSIDNRPRTLAITGVDFTVSEKDEMLRHFLLNLGEFESVDPTPTITHVSFPDRKAAEKFYYSLHGKQLPNVDGKLELSWVNNPSNTPQPPRQQHASSSAPASASAAKKAVLGEDDSEAQLGDAMAGMDDEQQQQQQLNHQQHEERQVDMDYEVADEDAWAE